jgi:hypothetical protein
MCEQNSAARIQAAVKSKTDGEEAMEQLRVFDRAVATICAVLKGRDARLRAVSNAQVSRSLILAMTQAAVTRRSVRVDHAHRESAAVEGIMGMLRGKKMRRRMRWTHTFGEESAAHCLQALVRGKLGRVAAQEASDWALHEYVERKQAAQEMLDWELHLYEEGKLQAKQAAAVRVLQGLLGGKAARQDVRWMILQAGVDVKADDYLAALLLDSSQGGALAVHPQRHTYIRPALGDAPTRVPIPIRTSRVSVTPTEPEPIILPERPPRFAPPALVDWNNSAVTRVGGEKRACKAGKMAQVRADRIGSAKKKKVQKQWESPSANHTQRVQASRFSRINIRVDENQSPANP